nr:uncharacterized protein LOC115270181 [Aedes albopictus]
MHRKRYFPADLEPYPLHYAALRGDTNRIGELISARHNCFQPIQDGETALHVAIAEGQEAAARMLFGEFRKQFAFVEEQCEIQESDKFWTNGCVLIAVGDEEIRRVKQLEADSVPVGNPLEGVLILMKNPVGENELAVLDPSKLDRVSLFQLVESLIPNGFGSWNSTGVAGKCESLLMLAAYYGNFELLELLIEQGADLNVAGPEKRTPFHAACEASQQKVIELLLTKYLDRFDPTALDENAQHGLHYILNRKNRNSFELTVDKMVEYRSRKFGETPSVAFNAIFKLENEEWPYTGIWNQLDAAFWDKSVEVVLERYEYDLRYRWKEVIVLIDMIDYKKARKFYRKAISKEVDLLNITAPNGFTPLHGLICTNERKLVSDLYRNHPEVKNIFENKRAFHTLSYIMQKEFIGMMEFILSSHSQFFQEHLRETLEQVIQEYNASNYENVFAILLSFLPSLDSNISEKLKELSLPSATQEFNDTYDELLQDFNATNDRIRSSGRTLDSYASTEGKSFLKQAILENQIQLVQQLLDAGVNFDSLDSDGCHAIHHVASLEMLQLITERHPKGSSLVNLKDRNGFTLLHVLCPSNAEPKKELIVAVLNHGANLNERTNDQKTVLFYTYYEDLFTFFTKGIQSFGYSPVNLELRDNEGNTAIHHLLCHRNSYIGSIMLRSSNSFANFNDKGNSYLSYMLRFDRDHFDSWLKPVLETYPDKTREMFQAEFDRSRDRTSELFVEACANMNVYCIEYFLRMDLNFNVRDSTGRVGLLELLNGYELPSSDIVFKLLEKSIDVNLQNTKRQNALMILENQISKSKETGFIARFALKMIEYGLNLEHDDDKGDTIMHYACRNGDFELLRVLVQNGASFSFRNRAFKRPVEIAAPCISQILNYLSV